MSSLGDRLRAMSATATPAPAPAPTLSAVLYAASTPGNWGGGQAVGDSVDLQRILALPRRTLAVPDKYSLKYEYGRPGCADERCPLYGGLRDIQASALLDAQEIGGLLAPIGVGFGKTLLSLLLPTVLGSRKAVLLVPPQLREQLLQRDIPHLAQHWRIPNLVGGNLAYPDTKGLLWVVSYSALSSAKQADVLEDIGPDLVVADEAHSVRHTTAARTKRFTRYFKKHPETRLCAMSGTLTSRSIKDYCLDPDARVLTADLHWVPAGEIKEGQELVGFDETLGRCKMRSSQVEAVRRLVQPRVKITTDRGEVVCSTLHGWVLCGKNGWKHKRRWIQAFEIKAGDSLAFYVEPWEFDASREGGYLAGLLDGEGWVSKGQVGFGQLKGPVLDRYCEGLTKRGFSFSANTSEAGVTRILPNGESPGLRLLGMLQPDRLMAKSKDVWEGRMPWGKNTKTATVLKVELLEEGGVVAIQTSTRTLITEGFLTHNSHLAKYALKDGSPLPLHYPTLQDWSWALDSSDTPAPPGALMAFCKPGEDVRQGFQRRLVETPGVVATDSGALGTSLVFYDRPCKLDAATTKALLDLRTTWAFPDGDSFSDALTFHRAARQLSCGVYLKWIWPREEPLPVRMRWLATRKDWHKALREKLKTASQGMDSPLLLARAAARGDWDCPAYAPWAEAKDTARPETEAVWVSDCVVRNAVEWGQKNTGVIWTETVDVGAKIAELGGFPFYGAGKEASAAILGESGKRTIVAGIKSHGTGKNLQMFETQLITACPSNGATMEQLLGRLHRPGQNADEVQVHVYRHTSELVEALESAHNDARYIRDSMGSEQKLLQASYTFPLHTHTVP